jgi:hypothetical protein
MLRLKGCGFGGAPLLPSSALNRLIPAASCFANLRNHFFRRWLLLGREARRLTPTPPTAAFADCVPRRRVPVRDRVWCACAIGRAPSRPRATCTYFEPRARDRGRAPSSKYEHGREDEHVLSWTRTITPTQPRTVVWTRSILRVRLAALRSYMGLQCLDVRDESCFFAKHHMWPLEEASLPSVALSAACEEALLPGGSTIASRWEHNCFQVGAQRGRVEMTSSSSFPGTSRVEGSIASTRCAT